MISDRLSFDLRRYRIDDPEHHPVPIKRWEFTPPPITLPTAETDMHRCGVRNSAPAMGRESVSRPIMRGFMAITIMTAIRGAASRPFTTALQYRAFTGSSDVKFRPSLYNDLRCVSFEKHAEATSAYQILLNEVFRHYATIVSPVVRCACG